MKMSAFDAVVAIHGARHTIDARFVTRMQHVVAPGVEIAFEKTVAANGVGSKHADAAQRRISLPHMRRKSDHDVGDGHGHVRQKFVDKGVAEKARQDDRIDAALFERAHRVEYVNLELRVRHALRSRPLPRTLLEDEIEWSRRAMPAADGGHSAQDVGAGELRRARDYAQRTIAIHDDFP